MNQIHKCTKPYIVEGVTAGFLDFGLFFLIYIIISALDKNYSDYILIMGIGLAIAVLWDMKTVYSCVLDRICKKELSSVVTFEDIGIDISYTDKFTRNKMTTFPSLLSTWYYPKEWSMDRVKLVFRTSEKKIKLRLIWSEKHGQFAFWDDLRILQDKFNTCVSFKVSYCKYSKVLTGIQITAIPCCFNQKQQKWISQNVSDTFRWMLSKKLI